MKRASILILALVFVFVLSGCINTKTVTLDVNPTNVNLQVGEEKTLQVNTNPSDALVIYQSDDPAIASVSGDGVIKGLSIGETVVTVYGLKENYNYSFKEVDVTVSGVTYSVTFFVKENGEPVEGALVEFNGETISTDSNGKAIFDSVSPGENKPYSVSKEGHESVEGTVDVVDEDVTVNVSLEKKTYIITATAGEGGSISPSGDIEVGYGEDKTFNIEPDEGYHIDDVLVDGESVGVYETYTFEDVDSDHTIHAEFSETPLETYDVTFVVSSEEDPIEGAEVTFDSRTLTTDSNGEVVFSDVPVGNNKPYVVTKEGYETVEGTVDVIDQDVTVNVSLEVATYVINASSSEGGTITPSGEIELTYGESITFAFTPDENYEVKDVLVDGVSQGELSEYTFENVSSDHTIHVEFGLITHIITATAGTGGTINPSGEIEVDHKADQSFTISANTGYHIDDVVVDGTSQGAITEYTFNNVVEDHSIDAYFEPNQYTISLSANPSDGGSVSGGGTYFYNENITVSAKPNTGWIFLNWKEDGDVVSNNSDYSFTVKGNRELVANFSRAYDVTFVVSDNDGAVQGATVSFNGTSKNTDSNGEAVFNDVTVGNDKPYTVSKTGYETENGTVDVVDEDVTVNVSLTIKTYTVSITENPPEGGSTSGEGTYEHGESVTVQANPASGYEFNNWTEGGDVVSTSESYNFNITSNRELVANFVAETKGTFIVNDKTVTNGSYETITVDGKDFGSVRAIQFVLSYDESYFDIVTVGMNSSFKSNSGWTLFIESKTDEGIIDVSLSGDPYAITSREPVIDILLIPKKTGTTNIGYTSYTTEGGVYTETAVVDEENNKLTEPDIELVPGTITIQ